MIIPDLKPGKKRQWLKCRTCQGVSFYDYTPYSLENPIRTQPCSHGVTARDMGADGITSEEAMRSLNLDAAKGESDGDEAAAA
jgi:hypothetical protein